MKRGTYKPWKVTGGWIAAAHLGGRHWMPVGEIRKTRAQAAADCKGYAEAEAADRRCALGCDFSVEEV